MTGRSDAIAARPRDEIGGSALDPGRPLVWRRSLPLVPDFELRQGETVFGEMEHASRDDMDATGECLGHALDLRMDSNLLRGVRVETRGSETELDGPHFQGLLCGWGRIRTPHGEELRWRHAFLRMYDHVLMDGRGDELLRLRPSFLRFGRTETRVLLSQAGWARPDLAELLLLTWFLRAHAEARGRRIFKRSKPPLDPDFPRRGDAGSLPP